MEEKGRRSSIEERVNLLKDAGYVGFSIKGIKKTSNGIRLTVENSDGIKLSAEGEVMDEVYENSIEAIDYFNDDKL